MVGAVIGQIKYKWLEDDEGATLTSGAGTMLLRIDIRGMETGQELSGDSGRCI